MFSNSVAKSKLRQEIKQRLSSMTVQERSRQSSIVTEKVLSCPEYKRSGRVCLYLSMSDEVSTLDILKDVFASGKTCFVPRYTKTEMEMLSLFSYEDYLNLPLTKWNIKQPEATEGRVEALASGGLDLILVPGLAFSATGHRLGRGKGYYDTYLAKCFTSQQKTPPVTIGLAYREQIVDHIPTDEHDKPIDKVFWADL